MICASSSTTLELAIAELHRSWRGQPNATITLVVKEKKDITGDGYQFTSDGIEAGTDLGILYGVFALLRHQQTGEPLDGKAHNPSYERRILDHWDNPDGSVERGYAGGSIFWRSGRDSLRITGDDSLRWQQYARANASIGINGSVINNVNASPLVLTPAYLRKIKSIADIVRPYGIHIYLSVNFASPSLIGGLKTSDPLDPAVKAWWKAKAAEIYKLIPDFGGFLVKASSEGQPGPQNYGRTHADGANTIAEALKPFGGIVMWRAFVYASNEEDRAKQAYSEFMPLDGKFLDNVIIQVKNGPIDFQPREPFSPLFGAMQKTAVMPELQVTQEYLGQSTHLVFLATMWQEFLQSDTYQEGKGSTVARCTDGSIFHNVPTAIAGVANTGLDQNWCGHPFAQANWYAFGRLAWDDQLTSEQIADEWLKLTFKPNPEEGVRMPSSSEWQAKFLEPVKQMMLESREAAVNYMTPLGLHHLFSMNHFHYGPGPWWAPEGVRNDWTPPYFHKADSMGIGFDRTDSGSDAVSQYHEPLRSEFNNVQTCPEIYLLWFHHLPWNYTTKAGITLWDQLCDQYSAGVDEVRGFQNIWDGVRPYVDADRFQLVQARLRSQLENAQVWRDACLLYFQQFSRLPFPPEVGPPVHTLKELMDYDYSLPR